MDVGVLAGVPASSGRGEVAEADPPLLTYYDDVTGERTELSAAALGGWASRTAGLLREGCGLDGGGRVAVLSPPHWQTAAVLLGAWSAGLAVSFRLWATAGLPVSGPGEDGPLDAVFVARARLGSWLEEVPQARHRFVLGLSPAADGPAGYRDYLACRRTRRSGVPTRPAWTGPPSGSGGPWRVRWPCRWICVPGTGCWSTRPGTSIR
jgi:hypothetical protein